MLGGIGDGGEAVKGTEAADVKIGKARVPYKTALRRPENMFAKLLILKICNICHSSDVYYIYEILEALYLQVCRARATLVTWSLIIAFARIRRGSLLRI
jgi:hypothetical protein